MNEPAHASASSAFARGPDIAGNLLLAAAYALAGIGGLHLTFFHPNVTSVWPPSGIALAALLIFGPKLLPGVAIGAFLVVLWLSGDLVASTGVALGNTLAAWVGYTLLRRVDFDAAMLRLRDPAALLFWGAILAPAIAATLGPASMWASGLLPATEYRDAWTVWWIGDALGVLLFVPLILLGRELLRGIWRAPRAGRAWVYIAVQAALAFAIFHGLASERFGLQEINYFLLPFAVWLALRHEPPFTAIANAAVFAIAVWGTAAGSGPFAGASAQGSLLLLHLFVAVFCCTTLLIASTSAERHRALRAARASSNELRSLADLSHDWYWEQDENLRYSRVGRLRNAEPSTNIVGQIGKTRWEVPYTGVSAEQREALDRLIAERKPFYDFPLTRIAETGERARPRHHQRNAGGNGYSRERSTLPQPDRTVLRLVLGAGCRFPLHLRIAADRADRRLGKRTFRTAEMGIARRADRRAGPRPPQSGTRGTRAVSRVHLPARVCGRQRTPHVGVGHADLRRCGRLQGLPWHRQGCDRRERGGAGAAGKRGTLPQPDRTVLRLVLGTGREPALHPGFRRRSRPGRHRGQRITAQNPLRTAEHLRIRGDPAGARSRPEGTQTVP
jgi:integral membrane sensor domain MASE1